MRAARTRQLSIALSVWSSRRPLPARGTLLANRWLSPGEGLCEGQSRPVRRARRPNSDLSAGCSGCIHSGVRVRSPTQLTSATHGRRLLAGRSIGIRRFARSL